MKIMMLNYEYPPLGGGGAYVTRSLSEELVNRGHDVDVITMGFNGLKKFETINDVNIFRIPCFRKSLRVCSAFEMFSFYISGTHFISNHLKENNYDINHSHFIVPTGLISNHFKNEIPYIITAHGSDVPYHNPEKFAVLHKLIMPSWKQVLNNASAVTAPSEYLKSLIKKNSNNIQNIFVINHGIDLKKFHSIPKENMILMVGRLIELKGFQYALEAIHNLKLDYEINIVGDGPFRSSLERKAKEYDLNINFLGWIDNKSDQYINLFGKASIFIYPSRAESFGMVLLEAMASECAIITSKSTGCKEVVGDTAQLVEANNVNDITYKLSQFIENEPLMKEFGRNAKLRVEKYFSWDHITDNYEKLYENILSGSNLNENL
jgi:glycosyltransferase involved in cell wall biosynthesis